MDVVLTRSQYWMDLNRWPTTSPSCTSHQLSASPLSWFDLARAWCPRLVSEGGARLVSEGECAPGDRGGCVPGARVCVVGASGGNAPLLATASTTNGPCKPASLQMPSPALACPTPTWGWGLPPSCALAHCCAPAHPQAATAMSTPSGALAHKLVMGCYRAYIGRTGPPQVWGLCQYLRRVAVWHPNPSCRKRSKRITTSTRLVSMAETKSRSKQLRLASATVRFCVDNKQAQTLIAQWWALRPFWPHIRHIVPQAHVYLWPFVHLPKYISLD